MILRHVGIVTKNLPKALSFWGDLGFALRLAIEEDTTYISSLIGKKIEGLKTFKLSSGSGCEIELLNYSPEASKEEQDFMFFGLNHVAITVPDIRQLDTIVTKHGFKMLSNSIQQPKGAKVKVCYYKIHDGVLLEAVQEL